MRVHTEMTSRRWYVALFDDEHNHEVPSPKFCEMLRSHRRMSKGQVNTMNSMRNVGISTQKIQGILQPNLVVIIR